MIEPVFRQLQEGIASIQVATDDARYLGKETLKFIAYAHEQIKKNSEINVLIFEGGKKYFSAGAHVQNLLNWGEDHGLHEYIVKIPHEILSIPVPTIAAMSGHAMGGGFVLGLWCDFAFLAEESLYGANFMDLGFTPGMGSTVVLEDVFGKRMTRKLLYTGKCLKGKEIKTLGCHELAPWIVPKDEVFAQSLSLAEELNQLPHDPLVTLKQRFSKTRCQDFDIATKLERDMHAYLFSETNVKEDIAMRYPKKTQSSDKPKKRS